MLEAGLCFACLQRWQHIRNVSTICPLCGSFDGGQPCTGPCADNPGTWPTQVGSLAGIVVAAPYTGVYRQRIMALKYSKARALAAPLAHLMAGAWYESKHSVGVKPLLVPVPVHKLKEAQRGYNQSLLLARSLSSETGLVVAELICRPEPGQVQAGLDKRQRQKALDSAFKWKDAEADASWSAGVSGSAGASENANITGSKAVLRSIAASARLGHTKLGHRAQAPGPAIVVDDVVTTGATLENIGLILLDHGYKPVWGLAFAGGSGRATTRFMTISKK